jgi:tetratricopeptide (TPR) repeat protein
MKKILLVLMLSSPCTILFAQQKDEADKIVEEQGIPLHDKGDYPGAIAKYDEALKLDADNLLALAEKAYSLVSMERYEESIQCCQKAIEKHAGDNNLRMVYVTYGNALDALDKPEKALEVYDEGIKQIPTFYQLYFNKGITLAGLEKYEEAIVCFQRAATYNPKHGSSNNALGRLLMGQNKRIPSILAYSRFLVLEPQSKRASENLTSLQKLMKANVEETGKKSVTINVSADMLKKASSEESIENNFATTDLILSMSAAMDYDKKYKDKTEVEQFIRKFESICSSLKEVQAKNHGFYWDYYVPYFVAMNDKKLIETFAYIAFASSAESDVSAWLGAHKNEIDQFYEWSESFAWTVK